MEGQVRLVLKSKVCGLQRPVDAQLLGLGERLGLTAVLASHVVQQR